MISVQETRSRIIKQSFDNDSAAETLNIRERLMKVRLFLVRIIGVILTLFCSILRNLEYALEVESAR